MSRGARAMTMLAALALAGCVTGPALGPRVTRLPADGGAVLPARYTRGVFLLHAEFEGADRPHWLLLDTGTDRTLLDLDFASRLGLAAEAAESIVTATGSAVTGARLRRLPRLRLGEANFEDVDVVGVDLGTLREAGGLPIAGIAGCDLFRQCLLEIDYLRRSVRVLPRATAPDGGGHAFAERSPWVDADIAGTRTRVLIDTGFQHSLALPPATALPWRRPPRPGGDIATIDGTTPKLLARLDGDVALGALRWPDPWIVLVPGSPKLGARLLQQCLLRLDAGGGRIWLDPAR
ncbi:MAG: aspartyl protease family protein [Planctomycetota bacterium]